MINPIITKNDTPVYAVIFVNSFILLNEGHLIE